LVDHRYFYAKKEPGNYLCQRGNYTCGLVRDAVADKLLELEVNFADSGFLNSLGRFIDNPSVTGFIMEHAVLSVIRSKGLAIAAGIGNGIDLRGAGDLKTEVTERPVLYRLQKLNFKNIDGIILWIKPDEQKTKKMLLFPLQITLAPGSHSDSRTKFFEEWPVDRRSFSL